MATMSDTPPPTSDPLLPDLTERIRSGCCHAFIGAGMSLTVYPTWNELIEQVCRACGVNTENMGSKTIPRLQLAQIARDKDRCAYFRELRNIFKPAEPTHRHHLLAKLPFKSYLTTNYDSLLLKACEFNNDNGVVYSKYPGLEIEHRTNGEVVFLHGRIDPTDLNSEPKLVLTENDFEEAYKQTSLRSFLEQHMTFNNVCFFGCSLEDEYLRGVFRYCKKFRDAVKTQSHSNDPRWFILIDQKSSLSDKWKEMGIEPVHYDKVNSGHDGLCAILEDWVGKKSAVLRPLGVSYSREKEVPR